VPLLSIVLLLVVWQLIVVLGHVNTYVAPRPWAAITAITSNWSTLQPLMLGTLRETIYGFFCGATLGIALGVVMAKVPFLQKLIYPLLVLSQAVPSIALATPLVLIFGLTIKPIIIVVAWIVFFPVTVSIVDGLSHVDPDLLNLAKVYGASRRRTFWQIEVPAAITPLFSGLKIGATYAVTGAIIGELASSTGSNLAEYQQHANANFNTAAVYGTTILMTVIGISWFLLVVGVETWCTPWMRRTTARRRLRRH
jgi:ABC-type nitrate/sulfonate/bicarbonate transport system permease component